jgi:hypothetical protein
MGVISEGFLCLRTTRKSTKDWCGVCGDTGIPKDDLLVVVFEADTLCSHPYPKLVPEYDRAPSWRIQPHVFRTPEQGGTLRRRLTPVATLFQP